MGDMLQGENRTKFGGSLKRNNNIKEKKNKKNRENKSIIKSKIK
jgi:hypothetical protein